MFRETSKPIRGYFQVGLDHAAAHQGERAKKGQYIRAPIGIGFRAVYV
jgi:hypothetical protein